MQAKDHLAINGDHDPAAFATCLMCQRPTFRSVIPTAAGLVVVYVCDACDAPGPRIFIPHIDRFEQSRSELKTDNNLRELLRLVKGARVEP
jgi:hypothetical protein